MEEAPQTTIQSNSHSVLGRTPKQWVFVILGINVIIFSIFLLTGGYYLIKNSFFSKTSGGGEIISGKIDLNGHIPDSATIIVSTLLSILSNLTHADTEKFTEDDVKLSSSSIVI